MNKAFLEDLCAKIQLPEEDRELAFQEMSVSPSALSGLQGGCISAMMCAICRGC